MVLSFLVNKTETNFLVDENTSKSKSNRFNEDYLQRDIHLQKASYEWQFPTERFPS